MTTIAAICHLFSMGQAWFCFNAAFYSFFTAILWIQLQGEKMGAY